MKRIHLTTAEIDAILGVAGDIDPAHFESYDSEKEGERAHENFVSGLSKLRDMLAKREARRGR
jgi:hypothetical protein